MPKKNVKNGPPRRHLGLHLFLTSDQSRALDAAVAREQARVGESAKVSVSSYVLGVLCKHLRA
jgi:hypothetical protein